MECEIVGCDDYAEYYDDSGNALCADCVGAKIDDEGYSWDDFEEI